MTPPDVTTTARPSPSPSPGDGDVAGRVAEHDLAVSELDRLVFGSASPFELDAGAADALRVELVRQSLRFHSARCEPFGRLLAAAGCRPDGIRTAADLDHVPVIPTWAFKRTPVTSVPEEAVVHRCVSSGTRGSLSVVRRDAMTLDRLLGSVTAGLRLVGDWYESDVQIVNLGPDQAEAGQVWFAYVMSLAELVHPTHHLVRDGQLDLDGALGLVRELLASVPHVGVIGPPMAVLRLAERARHESVGAADRMTVMTAGGWKTTQAGALDREAFRDLVATAFGLHADGQVRDAFNQVELNTVLVECSAHRKHVPPWLHVVTRSPTDLSPLPPGTPGLLSYLDPTAQSYPCFIVGDDIGVVSQGPCPCGVVGRVVEVTRRVELEEGRGCALVIETRQEERR